MGINSFKLFAVLVVAVPSISLAVGKANLFYENLQSGKVKVKNLEFHIVNIDASKEEKVILNKIKYGKNEGYLVRYYLSGKLIKRQFLAKTLYYQYVTNIRRIFSGEKRQIAGIDLCKNRIFHSSGKNIKNYKTTTICINDPSEKKSKILYRTWLADLHEVLFYKPNRG